ncbi:hypothetical protein [Guyparkeria sp.]|uniref:hypothetical protein n=1 Tax=Guyparkeria sp. TaxID=2035736 RepID=UPI00397112D3
MTARAIGGSDITGLLARHDIWRGRQTRPPDSSAAPCPSGWSALDELLGGGWPSEGLVELYAGRATSGIWRHPCERLDTTPLKPHQAWFQSSLGHGTTALLMPWLHRQTQTGRVALINPPALPCAERWQREGVQLDNLLVIQPQNLRELGWATEEVLQSRVYPLVVAWLPPLGFALRRRLKLAAETGGGSLVTPYPLSANMAAGTTMVAPSSPAWAQLVVHRRAQGLSVRRLKPFHPREVHLELDAVGVESTPPGTTDAGSLRLIGSR